MHSGDPAPLSDLRLVLGAKRLGPSPTMDVVGTAAGWLKAQLKGADIPFEYVACDEPHYGYAEFSLLRKHRDQAVSLSLKVAEIRAEPYVFAEVHSLGRATGTQFPYFGSVGSDDSRELLLHYIADFLLSSEPT